MSVPRIHHLALRASDVERSAGFYRLLGLEESHRVVVNGELRAIWLQASNTVLMLERALRGTGAADGSGHVLVFAVGNLAAAEDLLRRHAIPVDDRTAATLYVRDPDGHRVGLSVHRFEATPR